MSPHDHPSIDTAPTQPAANKPHHHARKLPSKTLQIMAAVGRGIADIKCADECRANCLPADGVAVADVRQVADDNSLHPAPASFLVRGEGIHIEAKDE